MHPAFDYAAVTAALGDQVGRFDVESVDECASTSTRLLERAEQGAPSGSVVIAMRQTAGRGRRGRVWLAPEGGSLAFSLLWRLAPGAPPPMGLSLAVGLAVARALEEQGVRDVGLKWPNDVLIQGRKLAGVLVELAHQPGRGLAVVIGIGLNLRLPPDFPESDDFRATDLARLLPSLPARENCLGVLLRHLAHVLDCFCTDGFASLREAWQHRHAHQDCAVRLLEEQAPALAGICRGVDGDGALLLETATGLRRILAGEVSLREPIKP